MKKVLIRIERSGGFAGVSKFSEIDSKYLPSDLRTKARKIAENLKSSPFQFKVTKSGPADYYNYKIFLGEGKDQLVIECNENNIQSELRSLVKYIEKQQK